MNNTQDPIALNVQYVGLFEDDPQWGVCLRYKIERFEDNARFNGTVFALNPNSFNFDSEPLVDIEYRIEEGYFLSHEMDENQKILFTQILQEVFRVILKSIMDNLDGEVDGIN